MIPSATSFGLLTEFTSCLGNTIGGLTLIPVVSSSLNLVVLDTFLGILFGLIVDSYHTSLFSLLKNVILDVGKWLHLTSLYQSFITVTSFV